MNYDIDNLPEVISKKHFHALFKQVASNQSEYSKAQLIHYLDILGEKYGKFYDHNELTSDEKDSLLSLLIYLTDFTSYEIMEALTSILFSFNIDKYAEYLKNNLHLIVIPQVYNEINDALIEYNSL